MRAGIGYDIHRLQDGRRLVLGGIEFTGETGLAGYSDADVLSHAVIDALLGAAGLGDIGSHFPPGDPRFEGADSIGLLRQTARMLRERGFEVESVDSTVIAERPRLSGHIGKMRERLAEAIGIAPERVNVKAKTNEGVGDIGRGEAIAAMAVALVSDSERPTA